MATVKYGKALVAWYLQFNEPISNQVQASSGLSLLLGQLEKKKKSEAFEGLHPMLQQLQLSMKEHLAFDFIERLESNTYFDIGFFNLYATMFKVHSKMAKDKLLT